MLVSFCDVVEVVVFVAGQVSLEDAVVILPSLASCRAIDSLFSISCIRHEKNFR